MQSGLVLDIYDDFRGETLRSLYPRQSDMPESVKTAQVLSPEDRNLLPDDCFALVMIDGSDKLRKYACIDEGNTRLSVEYFLKNAHKLPAVAQKTAAENLMKACGWYDLEIPTKLAEVTGTTSMPYQEPHSKKMPPTTIPKSASVGHLVKGHKGEHGNFGPEETEHYNGYTKGKNFDKLPQGKVQVMDSRVEVTGQRAPDSITEKKASSYALPAIEKYPLDSYAQVKTASAYFDEFAVRFDDADRKEFATNLVKRASALGIDVSDAARYHADPEEAVKLAFERPWSEVIGNDYVDECQLECLAKKGGKALEKAFDEDFVKEFRKDPKGIFLSLPRDQKILIMRMASDNSPSTL